MELKDYWLTIRRRWRMMMLCLMAVVAAASLWTWQTTPQYASSAQLFVSTAPSDSGDAYTEGLFATQRVTTYADLVGTRKLAEQVSDDLGGDLSADLLRASVTAEVVPETVSLRLSATHPDNLVARDIAQAYAEALRDLIADIETPEGQDAALVTAYIVDNAQVTTTPVSPDPVRNIGLGVVLGLLLGVGLAFARDLLDTSVSSSEDVAQVTTSPILGHIKNNAAAVKKEPALALAEATPWAEAFRVLRTNMQFVEVDHDRRVFVVSSSLPGEGKSTTVINLALTLAMAGQRVALVDCDLRRPVIASRLGLDDAIGTTSVLIGQVSLSDALQKHADSGLTVLACGPRPPNPSELLQSHSMARLIADLREEFDVVLLDAPPLLPVTDAALLSAQSDGVLAVVHHGKTSRDQLQHALARIEQVDSKCVGVVINLAPDKKPSHGYGYGYGYGYSYAPLTHKGPKAATAMNEKGDSGRGSTSGRGSGRRRGRPGVADVF